jgi:hypothetical protein
MTENELLEKLRTYPELKVRVEQLITIVENSDGKTTLADEAERRVIEELRGLGHDALQGWATRQSEKATDRVLEQQPNMRKHVKKKSSGIPPMEKS